jgi:hypothetical protein
MTLWSLVTGFVGGVCAWFLTTAVAQPFQRFITLRQEAAVALVDFEDRLWIGNPEAKPPTQEWLAQRLNAYDRVGTNLVAFAASNSFITRLLYQPILGRYRCYVSAAGENLRILAATYPGTQIAAAYHENVVRELHIVTGPAARKSGPLGKAILILGLLAWALTAGLALNALSNNRYAREPDAILKALVAIPPIAVIFLLVGMIGLTVVGMILGASRADCEKIWQRFSQRWKGLFGLILLISVAIAVGTRTSTFWR